MSVAPEVGVGLGRIATDRIEGCVVKPSMMCDPTDAPCLNMPPVPSCTDPNSPNAKLAYVGDNFHAATITPRVSAALHIALPLFEHVWLDGFAQVMLAPLGHTTDFSSTQPAAANGNITGDATLPGEPTTVLQLGIGLRLGMP
jgi:hypothetical protein